MMLLPFSKRRTMPRMSSPLRSLYSLKMRSRSASRTRWRRTCLAVCAAMRPNALRACFSLSRSPNSLSCCARLLGVLGRQKTWKPSSSPSSASRPRLLGVLDGDLALGLGDRLDDGHVLEEVDLAGLFVEARLELARRAEGALRRLEDGRFDGLDEDLLVDALFFRDLLQDEAEVGFGTGRGGLCGHDGMPLSVSLVCRASHGCAWAGPEARR